jgi:molybdenum cofactor biosynthesis enzyme MoaA
LDWVAFQCLWPCEYAASGQPCQFCFSGGDFENASKKGKALPNAVPAADIADIVSYALKNDGVSHVQITGGSTFDGRAETKYITEYLNEIKKIQLSLPGWSDASVERKSLDSPARPYGWGEILLYITPPSDTNVIDNYFNLGASRIACSLEVWDSARAREITPGKVSITGRDKHLKILEYIAQKYGNGKAFSNFIIGIEDFETLAEGAKWLAERGIMPSASVWMPMGRPVQGSMKAPGIDYYKRVKELFSELYNKYNLEPTASRGLNVCIERDIWNYSSEAKFDTGSQRLLY